MTEQEQDEKDFKEWLLKKYPNAKYWSFRTLKIKDMELAWCDGRRTLREKIKADPSIGKLEVEDWPESPDY